MENVTTGKNVNVVRVAVYVTAQPRLSLYGYLRALDESVQYCDTDSVIYVQKGSEPEIVKIGDSLGDLTR